MYYSSSASNASCEGSWLTTFSCRLEPPLIVAAIVYTMTSGSCLISSFVNTPKYCSYSFGRPLKPVADYSSISTLKTFSVVNGEEITKIPSSLSFWSLYLIYLPGSTGPILLSQSSVITSPLETSRGISSNSLHTTGSPLYSPFLESNSTCKIF